MSQAQQQKPNSAFTTKSNQPLTMQNIVRQEALHTFIFKQGLIGELTHLAKDMSNRQYYRLLVGNETFVVMDAPPPEKPAQFVLLSDFLLEQGLRAPKVLSFDSDNGFILLEDFGDQTFSYILNNTTKDQDALEENLYLTATKVLQTLSGCKRPAGVDDYSVIKLLAEVEIFIDWYWQYAKGVQAPSLVKQPFMRLWEDLFNALPETPNTLVLRDFHVDNLMITDENLSIKSCGVLDFQDALWGSVVYDFVSLLEDARRDVSAKTVHLCSQQFLSNYPPELHEALELTAKVLAAARHVKVIGVFTRYAIRQHNDSKCVHLPRLWNYLEQHFKDPIFAPIAEWFSMYFPISAQHTITQQL
ncbi:MAG: phosphotransferase [Candidatus Paracaedibacteraceae bacterium]|nr:phosphotransferase [Candidatus Paracaedibacteraceae bacterium]